MAHLLLHGTLDATILEADTLTPRACALAPSLMHAAAPDGRRRARTRPRPRRPRSARGDADPRRGGRPAAGDVEAAGVLEEAELEDAPWSPLGRALASTRRQGRTARRNPGPSERGMRGEVPRGSGRRGLPVLRAGGGSVELERSLPARSRRGGEAAGTGTGRGGGGGRRGGDLPRVVGDNDFCMGNVVTVRNAKQEMHSVFCPLLLESV